MSIEASTNAATHPKSLRLLLERCGLVYNSSFHGQADKLHELFDLHEKNIRGALRDIVALADDMIPPYLTAEHDGKHYTLDLFDATYKPTYGRFAPRFMHSERYQFASLPEYMKLILANERARNELVPRSPPQTDECRREQNHITNTLVRFTGGELSVIHRPQRRMSDMWYITGGNRDPLPEEGYERHVFNLREHPELNDMPHRATITELVHSYPTLAKALFGEENLESLEEVFGSHVMEMPSNETMDFFVLGPRGNYERLQSVMGVYDPNGLGQVRGLAITDEPIQTYSFDSLSDNDLSRLEVLFSSFQGMLPQGVYRRTNRMTKDLYRVLSERQRAERMKSTP